MKKLLALLTAAALFLATPAIAQEITPIGPNAPCTAFGTAAGQCAQGGAITAGGPSGSATAAPIITYNAAGQLTAVTTATVTPAVGSITGLGTGVATALGNAANAVSGVPTQAGLTTWTPTNASADSVVISGVGTGYTKMGNMVFVYGAFTVTGTGVNTATYGSLPVTVANNNYGSVACGAETNAAVAIALYFNQNALTFFVVNPTTNAGITNTVMNGATIRFSCAYPAA